MQILYNIVAILLVILLIPYFIVRTIREKGFLKRMIQSFGFLPEHALDKVAGKKLYLDTCLFCGRNCSDKSNY